MEESLDEHAFPKNLLLDTFSNLGLIWSASADLVLWADESSLQPIWIEANCVSYWFDTTKGLLVIAT